MNQIILNKKVFQRLMLIVVFSLILISLSFSPAGAVSLIADPSAMAEQNRAFQQASGFTTATSLTLSQIVASVIKILLSLLGVIFIILLIYGGFLWLTSAGNEEKVTKAKNTISAAIIGLVIILSAYAITVFVIEKVVSSTLGPGGGEAPPGQGS